MSVLIEKTLLNFVTGRLIKSTIFSSRCISGGFTHSRRGGARRNLPAHLYPPKKPWNTGDLDPYPNFDLTKILRPGYEKSEELKTADEQVKRLFTLEFGTKDDILEYYTNHLVKAVQRHPLDQSSYEVLIAKITARIRMHIVDGDKDPFSMKRRKTVGDLHVMRNYLLNKLMHSDYDVYEWLKSILRIEHQHENPFAQVEHNARELERMKLQQQAFDIVQKKKDELKLRFANEKQKFQLEKEQLLIDIEKDLQNLRLDIIKYNEIRKQRTRTKVE